MVLVGRATEQETLARLLASARLGRGGALVVAGEPGVGKSALLADALDGAGADGGVRVLGTTPAETEQDLAFAVLHALLRPALGLLDDIPAPQAAELGAALSLRHGSGRDRFAIGAATLSLLSRFAEDGPVVLVLDDVQWADRPSVDALAFAARRLRDDPVAVLVAGRSDELPDAVLALPRLHLAGLDPGATATLLAAAFPAGTARAPDVLHRETGGNPLALLELAGDPVDAAAGLDAPGLPRALPARLQRAFARRLDALPAEARAAALVAAAADGDLRLTRAVCARLDLDPARLDDAERAGLLSAADGRVVFRHPLLRAVVHGDAEPALRRRVHRALADELGPGDEDRRAWHRAAAATGLDEGVAGALAAVGDRASARTAFTVASTAYERAARLSPDAGDARSRLVASARAAWSGGQPGRALALLDEAEPPAGPWSVAGAQLRATVALRAGSVRDGLDLLERAADLADVDDRVLLLAEACRASMYLVDTVALHRVEERLAAALPAATSPVSGAVGLAASGATGVLLGRDTTDRLAAAVGRLAAVDPLAHPAALPWLMLAPLFLRDRERGAELRALVDEVRTRVGVGALPDVLFHVARDQATSDAWDRAAANYDEAARLARETGQGGELAMALAGLASLESRAGRGAACREHAADATVLCEERSMRFGVVWCELALGDLALSEGESGEAVDRLTALAATLDERGIGDPDLHPGPELVDALLRTGRPAPARTVAERFADAAAATGRPWTRARADRALALVVPDDDEADRLFASALAHHARTRDVFERARTHLAHGMRLRRSGRRVAARAALRDAWDTFDGLGAQLWGATARTELEATGEHVVPRERHGPGALTPQELQVCLLLADGRTTRETAAALFLSPKTVEYHLRKVYTRLGIHSRDELAAVLADAG
ncbi:helix-turn-helix transcriptional regulator [Cellulosimicrobium composti]|uniref:Helix-turn-helix domain-containing protein n=1 Tax=Cellulosimicrobium composti TaxID=2672572 RepID=A0ABX0B799_9MICO|nr:LuxR family transcriptional regulator [Cellulosimicrobium composti]NDO87932.1 helix-turn-helix domain-containing protein [Cellulosimicrobium composti]